MTSTANRAEASGADTVTSDHASMVAMSSNTAVSFAGIDTARHTAGMPTRSGRRRARHATSNDGQRIPCRSLCDQLAGSHGMIVAAGNLVLASLVVVLQLRGFHRFRCYYAIIHVLNTYLSSSSRPSTPILHVRSTSRH